MISYILRRILYAIPVLLVVAFITILLFDVAAGDPAAIKLGKNPSAEEVAALHEEMGFNDPLIVKYGRYLVDTMSLDFGKSWNDDTPVRTVFARGVGPTLTLTIPAFVLGTLVSVILALLVAFYRGSMLDKTLTVVAIAAISISSLVYILVFQALLADQWKLFPIWGFEYGIGAATFVALPVLIWILLSIGTDMRYFRTVALEEISRDYVRTARSKGLSERKVLFSHVLRNCAIPIITRMAIIVPFLITGSFLLEIFFGIPGLGNTLFTAIGNSDLPVIKAFTMLGTVLYVFFDILADVAYAGLDPRVRLG